MDCSLPGFSVHGIFQARVLEWDAITFSNRCCGRFHLSFLFHRQGGGGSEKAGHLLKFSGRSWVLEKAMAPHSSTLAWKIPWMEEPGGLQPMGSLRVGHD